MTVQEICKRLREIDDDLRAIYFDIEDRRMTLAFYIDEYEGDQLMTTVEFEPGSETRVLLEALEALDWPTYE